MNKLLSIHIIAPAFELAVATAWFLVGLAYLKDPQAIALASPLGRYVGKWEYAWSILYLVSAPAIWFSVITRRPWQEAAALLLLATGLLMQGFASITDHYDPRALNYYIFAAAAITRSLYLLRGAPGEH